MGDRKELGDLVLAVVEDLFEIAEHFRFDPADEPDDRGFDLDIQAADIDGMVPAELAGEVREELAGVADVGGSTDAGRDEDRPRLLGRHRYPAGALL